MMPAWLLLMMAAVVVVMRPSATMMVIRDFGMNVEVGAVIAMVTVPDRALFGRSAGVDSQAIGRTQGTKSPMPALASRYEPSH